MKLTLENFHLQPQDSSIPQVQRAISLCWRQNPKERKKAAELLEILDGKEQEEISLCEPFSQVLRESDALHAHSANLTAFTPAVDV